MAKSTSDKSGREFPYFTIDKDGHIIPVGSAEASKHVYNVNDMLKETSKIVGARTDKKKTSDKDKKETTTSGDTLHNAKYYFDKDGHIIPYKGTLSEKDKKDLPDNIYYENGYVWIKESNGKKTKLTRWQFDNSSGANPSFVKNAEAQEAMTKIFGTYDKTYNPTGVKPTNKKLTGKVTKLGNTNVIGVQIGNRTLYVLDSHSEYSVKDINAAADKTTGKVKNIILKDTEIKSNINTNMNLDKLTNKQLVGLLKGDIKPTLSIKDDGKTIVATDSSGKKYTIKFKCDVSKVGSIYGIGDLRDLYTKGFSAKDITRLMKAADKTYTDAKYNTALKKLTDDLASQLERNAAVTGDRVNATTELSQVLGPTKWNPLRTSIDKDDSFGIWEEKGDKTTNSASANDVPTADNPTDGTDAASSIATYSSDGMLNISPANMGAATYAGKPVNTGKKQPKGSISRRLLRSDPLPFNGKSIDKPDTPWYEARGDIGSLYESGAGKTRESLMHSLGIWEGSPLTYLRLSATRYNRFKLPTPDSVLQKSFAHVFFVRPQCNVKMSASQNKMDEASHDNSSFSSNPNYMYAASNAPQIVHELSYDCMNQSSDFSFILSNAAISFSLNDEYINTDTYGTGYTGYKVSYGKHGVESRTAGEFTVSFQDDRNMDIYHMIKLWCDYIDGCYTGTYHPKADTILNHILDYTGAVYYILTAEDGETILFWSKYYGVYPSTIPSNQYSWSAGTLLSHITLDVKFNYSWKEDYNLAAIAEFNYNSRLEDAIQSSDGGNSVAMVPTYNKNLGTAGRTWVGAPFIETVYENGGEAGNYGNGNMVFKLRFRSE